MKSELETISNINDSIEVKLEESNLKEPKQNQTKNENHEIEQNPAVLRSSELRNSMPSITSVNSPSNMTRESPNILEAYRHLTTKAVEQ